MPPAQTPASGGPVWCRDHECADSDRPGFEVAGELVDELVALDPLLTLARALLGVECVPVRTEYFGSPGRITGPGPARQDQAFHAREVTGELTVTLWCPLFDVGADDGVREYAFPNAVPGQLLEHVDPPAPGACSELPNPERFTFRPVPLRCGDIVAHHAYAVHRSGPNRSGRHGGAVALSYRSSAHRMWPPR